MSALESKVPPPVVALIMAGLMWALSLVTPVVDVSDTIRTASASVLAVAGLVMAGAGIVSFARARTTVDPTHPQAASTLVVTGVYRVTRNPMYVGDVLFLVAWAVFLSSPLTLVVTPLFVLYMNRFQIGPEERAMAARFGERYVAYKARVRRWL